MNFMQLLNSLDELLYELMSWLIFFPITLWRSITRPLRMMEYADVELAEQEETQYTDTLSPPLFLLICLLISHAVELALGQHNPIVGSNVGLAKLVTDDTSLLLLRLLLFAVFPMLMSAHLLRAQRIPLTRTSLKPPFYAQCYAAGVFALFFSVGLALVTSRLEWAGLPGAILAIASLLFYAIVEARWFAAHLGRSFARGLAYALLGLVEGLAIVVLVGLLLT